MKKFIGYLLVVAIVASLLPFGAISALASSNEYTVVSYGQSGGASGTGIFLGANGTEATKGRAAKVDADGNPTCHSSSATVASSRTGVLTFDIDRTACVNLKSAVLKLKVTECNHTIDSNIGEGTGWMKIAVYETENNPDLTYKVGNMTESTYAAKNNDYSAAATMWSNEKVYRSGGNITVDVTRAVINAWQKNEQNSAPGERFPVVLRLQVPAAGCNIAVAGADAPKLEISTGIKTGATVKFVDEDGNRIAEDKVLDDVYIGDRFAPDADIVPVMLTHEGKLYELKLENSLVIESLSEVSGENVLEAVYALAGETSTLYEDAFTSDKGVWTDATIESGVLSVGADKTATKAIMMLDEHLIPTVDAERISIKGKVKSDNLSAGLTISVLNANGENISAASIHHENHTLCVRSFGSAASLGYYAIKDAEADKWYDIEFVYYPKLRRYHVYFDNQPAMMNLGYQTDGQPAGLSFNTYVTTAGNAYLDDVVITKRNTKMTPMVSGLDISVAVGEKIALPELVAVNYEDGFADVWSVVWDNYAERVNEEAVVNVKGTAASMYASEYSNSIVTEVEAVVAVRGESGIVFYVNPETGDDNNDGESENAAFRTIERARDAVRSVNDNMTGDIYVYLAGGTYNIDETIVFTAEDSGTNGYRVYYKAMDGETPIVSGGRKIEGWERVEGKGYFVADMKSSDGFDTFIRQIYVNDERAVRASSGWFKGTDFKRDALTNKPIGLIVDSALLKDYQDTTDLRLWKAKGFKMDEYRIYNLEDNGDGTTTLYCYSEEDGLFSWREGGLHFAPDDDWMITNAFEELNNPGEWWRDTVNEKVYYYPYSDQSVENIEVYATVMKSDQLVRVEGTTSDKVENIVIDGITFLYSNWMYPADYAIGGSQSEALWGQYGAVEDISYGYEVPGAVRLNHTNNIEFLNNTLGHMAGCGIHIYNDASNTRIEGNVTYDTTGAGIQVARFGGAYLNDDRIETESFEGDNLEGRVRDTLIKNNYISDTGRDFLQATGINIDASLRNTIIHNTVVNCAYMGIHTRMEVVGQYLTRVDSKYINPGTDTTLDIGQNIIAYNRTGQTAWAGTVIGINDNASIYNFGPTNAGFVYRNYIEPTDAQWSLYCDNNSNNIIWRENVIPKAFVRSNRLVDTHNVVLTSSNNSSSDPLGLSTLAGLEEDMEEIKERAIAPDDHFNYTVYKYLNLTDADYLQDDGTIIGITEATGTSTQAANPVTNVFDRNLDTYWGSGRNFPETLVMTLENKAIINKIDLYWYGSDGRKYKYKLYVSDDNETWTLVTDNSADGAAGHISNPIDNVSGKYVKLEVTGTSSSWGSAAIYEVAVYGEKAPVADKTITYKDGKNVFYSITKEFAIGEIPFNIKKGEQYMIIGDKAYIINSEKEQMYTVAHDGKNEIVVELDVVTENAVMQDTYALDGKTHNNDTTYYLFVGSSKKSGNNAPREDADGELTCDPLHDTTADGYCYTGRTPLLTFNTPEVAENEAVILKLYVGVLNNECRFNGHMKLGARRESVKVSESTGYNVTNYKNTTGLFWSYEKMHADMPVNLKQDVDYNQWVNIDVTEAVNDAVAAGDTYITFSLFAPAGGVYVADRESAMAGKKYQGKAPYLDVVTGYNVHVTGASKITKNGRVATSPVVVPDGKDIKLYNNEANSLLINNSDATYENFDNSIVAVPSGDVEYTLTKHGVNLVNGAQVRIGDGVTEEGKVDTGSGLRFIATVDRTDSLVNNADEIGVRITAEASNAYVDIPAEVWQDLNETIFTAALTNLSESNYNRKFTATPYLKVGDMYYFGNTALTRSIYQVAAGLLTKDNSDGTEYGQGALESKVLYDVLNAYVNQTGIRLAIIDNNLAIYNTEGQSKYSGDAFFTVSDAKYVDGKYSATLTLIGEKTEIKGYWNEFVRINNNNSSVKGYTTIDISEDGRSAVLTFDYKAMTQAFAQAD